MISIRMLEKNDLIEDIRLGFYFVEAYLRPGGKLNLTDANVHFEDLARDILNAAYDWHLENANEFKANTPCIDLIDKQSKMGIQVSSDNSEFKVNTTLTKLATHQNTLQLNNLKFFFPAKLPKYKVKSSFPLQMFDKSKDIIDFDKVFTVAVRSQDLNRTKAIHAQITQAIPSLYASKQTRLKELSRQITLGLQEFKREVFFAALQYEDPVRMYASIRDTRINLQRQGTSLLSYKPVAEAFDKARNILSTCEHGVQEKFPRIYAAVSKSSGVYNQVNLDYSDSEYYDAIRYMMDIRLELSPLLDMVQNELDRINAKLL